MCDPKGATGAEAGHDRATSPRQVRADPASDLPPRIRRAAMALLMLGIGLIVWFGLLSRFPAISYPALHGRGDLLQHVAAFAYMGLVSLVLWRPSMTVAVVLSASAALLEILQMASPLHQASVLDWAASSFGVALGAMLHLATRRLAARIRSGSGLFRLKTGADDAR